MKDNILSCLYTVFLRNNVFIFYYKIVNFIIFNDVYIFTIYSQLEAGHTHTMAIILHQFFIYQQCYGEFVSGSISDEQRKNVILNSCPGAGACGGMYTANTMASAIEAMGMSLPYRYVCHFTLKYYFENNLLNFAISLARPHLLKIL